MRYLNILPRHKKIPIWDYLQFIYVGVDMIEIADSILIIERYFYMI